MGRHTSARHDRRTDGRRRRGPALAAAALAAVVVGLLGWVVVRSGAEPAVEPAAEPTAAVAPGVAADVAAGCRVAAVVRVTVDPDLAGPVRSALDGPIPVAADRCAVAEVATAPSSATLAELLDGDPADQPQVWVPDDVSWAARAGAAVDPAVVELAATPVVLATSRAVADALGWTATPPTWAQALLTTGAVLPDPRTEAAGVVALAALRGSIGESGDTAVDAAEDAVLAAGGAGSTVPQALAAAVAGDPAAPVVVATEQQVATASSEGPGELVVVVPAEGAPTLVVPVLRTAAGRADAAATGAAVGATDDGTDVGAAVDAVLDRLVSSASDGAAVRAGGWRDPIGRLEGGAPPPPALPVAADLVAAVLARAEEQPGAP